ncbi:MAG TPA: hypothetical protein VHE35_28690, partial [Kofleriaceae bacterium]|nr:hypothetical protein [Kofleriaceae bacterium]
EVRAASAELETERRRRAELEAQLAATPTSGPAAPAGTEPERAAVGAPPPAMTEHLTVLQDTLASLRASMRAASDETAVMDQTDSVQVVSSALSQAAEDIERARDAVRALNELGAR